MKEFISGQLGNPQVTHFNTMNIDQVSRFLDARKETIRRFVAEDTLSAVKSGRGWCVYK